MRKSLTDKNEQIFKLLETELLLTRSFIVNGGSKAKQS